MRTVLIGSDFMYDKDGNLVPIEINTNVGWDGPEKVEDDADCLDFTAFDSFVKLKGFTTIHYIGDMEVLYTKLEQYCIDNSLSFVFHAVTKTAITVPYIEDNEESLIIRSSYDTTALVDDTYCRDKIEFMNLIKDSTFGSQFAYRDENNTIVNNITSINDNGEHPNFILKARLPQYDKKQYPKFYKVTTEEELNNLILNVVTTEYFLMEYLYNPTKMWEGHATVIRSFNLLAPPNLESIQLGQYTKLNQNILLDNVTYDSVTYEVDSQFRSSYNTTPTLTWLPKLLDTDMVEMADGSFKTALQLEIGDSIKTIDIPNENGDNIDAYITSEFGLTFETLSNSATYTTNIVTNKERVNALTFLQTLTFEDNSTWEDTIGSRYLIEKDDVVKFVYLYEIEAGDAVILINTTDNIINFVKKIVSSNVQSKSVFNGWFITVQNSKLFLTKTTTSTNNESFVSIEHNVGACPARGCLLNEPCPACPKQYPCCSQSTCLPCT